MTKKQSFLLMIGMIFLLLLGGCGADTAGTADSVGSGADTAGTADSVGYDKQEQAEEAQYVPKVLMENDTAPDFTAELAGGGSFTLSEQQGKVVLLNFWASWCVPCVSEMPAFEKLQNEYGDRLAVLAVNTREEKSAVDKYIENSGSTFPIAYDRDGEVCALYPTDGIPYTLLIGADGVIRKIYLGSAGADTQYRLYRSAIEKALAEDK